MRTAPIRPKAVLHPPRVQREPMHVGERADGAERELRQQALRLKLAHGLTALIDKQSKRYQELGLGAARLSDEKWMSTLVAEPMLLVQPLTRFGGKQATEWFRVDRDQGGHSATLKRDA